MRCATWWLVLALVGCAEARGGRDAGAIVPDGGRETDAGGGGTDGGGDTGAGAGILVVNEIAPEAPDWVELLNDSTEVFSLDGLEIIDDDDTHVAVPFPAGASLAPGARFIVAFDATCAELGLTERCLETTFGISGSAGDTIRVRAVAGAPVADASFPGTAAAGLEAGQTYGRIPDGSGAFRPTVATLAAANVAP